MSVNNQNHEHCSVCGKKLIYDRSEKQRDGVTLVFYVCPEASPNNDHDRAMYEVGGDVEVA